MQIQVIGSGCPTCKKLFEMTKEVAKQLNIKDEVEYIPDISKIIEMGLMNSPVLVIDGRPALVGIMPNLQQLKKIITGKKS